MTWQPAHRCPGPRCRAKIPPTLLACAAHWAQVPQAIKVMVYATWKRGAGAGTAEHMAAMGAAIQLMTELGDLPRRGPVTCPLPGCETRIWWATLTPSGVAVAVDTPPRHERGDKVVYSDPDGDLAVRYRGPVLLARTLQPGEAAGPHEVRARTHHQTCTGRREEVPGGI